MSQEKLMTHDPATGEPKPYPSHALQWRRYHGALSAWLFNPWTGTLRDARDVGSDPFGTLVTPPAPEERALDCEAPRRAKAPGDR